MKTERWGAGMVYCLERGADLHMAQLMPLPLTVSRFSKIQIGFTFPVSMSIGGYDLSFGCEYYRPCTVGRSDVTVLGHDTIRYYFVGMTRFNAMG